MFCRKEWRLWKHRGCIYTAIRKQLLVYFVWMCHKFTLTGSSKQTPTHNNTYTTSSTMAFCRPFPPCAYRAYTLLLLLLSNGKNMRWTVFIEHTHTHKIILYEIAWRFCFKTFLFARFPFNCIAQNPLFLFTIFQLCCKLNTTNAIYTYYTH